MFLISNLKDKKMKYVGRTVVVAKLLGADDVTAKFEINGQVFDIPAIEDQGEFLSPLNRIDEFPEPRTMKEFLMHPRKSAKRKLKKNDFVLLTLQRYMNEENNTKTISYKLQNAITFIRSVNTEDELDYKGFAFNVDDVQRFFKKDENLPLYLIKFSSAKKTNEEIKSIAGELLKNEIVNKFIFTYKVGEEFHKKNVVMEIKPELLKNEEDKEHFVNLETFESMVDNLEKTSEGKSIFNISFFHSGTKKKEILDKYENIFLKNAKTKNPKNDIEKIINDDIEAYYSHRRKRLDSESFYEKEIYGKIINDKGDFLMAPSIISFKQSRSNENEENSFYLISSIVPDVIAIRKRAVDYLKKTISQNEENIPDDVVEKE
jgi:hypothetical protein